MQSLWGHTDTQTSAWLVQVRVQQQVVGTAATDWAAQQVLLGKLQVCGYC